MFPTRILGSKTSLDYLLKAIPKSGSTPPTYTPKLINSTIENLPPADPTTLIITPNKLNANFQNEIYGNPTPGQLSRSQQFFNTCKIKLDWTLNDYKEIPDVKLRDLSESRELKFAKVEPYNRSSQYYKTASKSKKTFGITPDLLKPLPEILLLGNTNVGKSTLINTLFLNKLDANTAGALHEYAFTSRRAGYTKTLNCFNVNNKLRIIDTPGYGQFGETKQGETVMDYIENRRILRTVFLLIDGNQGFSELDMNMLSFLMEQGVSFDIIFTKVDQVIKNSLPRELLTFRKGDIEKFTREDRIFNADAIEIGNQNVIKHFVQLIEEAGLDEATTVPRIFFNTGVPSPLLPGRYGYKEIRYAILQSCGLVQ